MTGLYDTVVMLDTLIHDFISARHITSTYSPLSLTPVITSGVIIGSSNP